MTSEQATPIAHSHDERHVVCRHGELAVGEMRPFAIGRRELVVVRTGEVDYAGVSNRCPHEGARLSDGRVERMWVSDQVGTHRRGDRLVFVCPWHNFEYDAETGRSACEPQRLRLPVYRVTVEDGDVVLYA